MNQILSSDLTSMSAIVSAVIDVSMAVDVETFVMRDFR